MIAVIADDFTGAAELGAIGLRHGLRAELVRFDGLPSLDRDRTELVCVDTDSRNGPRSVAARRAAAVARALRNRGVTRIYKKVDSVLRGPVRAEVEAVCRALNLKRALLVSANPTAGRIVVGGCYLIRGRPLHQTDFRFDPEHPRRTARIAELLGRQGRLPVEVRPRRSPSSSLPARGVIVGEAARAADVRFWAGLLDGATLPAGAAEFFAAWLQRLGFHRVRDGRDALPHRRDLFVCGSASAATRAFVKAARRAGVVVLSPVNVSSASAAAPANARRLRRAEKALQRHGRVILAMPSAPIRDRARARRVAGQLVGLAAALIRRAQVEHVFVEGGATAAALTRRLGWTRLRVVAELAPGVVALQPPSGRSGLLVAKPGSYPWPARISEGVVCVGK